MARVELEKISKIYPGGVSAVDAICDLCYRLTRNSSFSLARPDAARPPPCSMVAGLEEITSGTLKIGPKIVNDMPPKDRDIAMVFQNYALYPHMSVYKNMAFGLKLRGMPKKQILERVGEAAKILEITHLLDRKPKALSGGQRQRVAVGRAIVREPAAFLFDEPLSNLDAKLRVTTRMSSRTSPPSQDHHHLCDPRSGRGHDPRRSHRGHERRKNSAGRHVAQGPITSRNNRFARRFYRDAAHEFLRWLRLQNGRWRGWFGRRR